MKKLDFAEILSRALLGTCIMVLIALTLNVMVKAPKAKQGLIKHLKEAHGVTNVQN